MANRKISFQLRILPATIILIGVISYFGFGWDKYLSFESLRDHHQDLFRWTSENRMAAVIFFVIGYALVVSCSLPGAIWMSLVGGFVFGKIFGTAVVVIAATIGATTIFLIARHTFSDFFKSKILSAGICLDTGFYKNSLSYLLFLRLVPIFPFWLVNIVPALLGVPLRVYLIATFVGIIPGALVYCSLGSGLGSIFEKGGQPDLDIIFQPDIFGPIVALSFICLIPVIYKRIKPF